MPIQIIEQDERLEFEYLGGTFYYRRPFLKEKQKWSIESKDSRGISDDLGVLVRAIPSCLLGWGEGAVVDSKNKPISFSEHRVLSLTEDFYLILIGKLGLAQPESGNEELEAKNSKDTSSSK